MLLNEKIFFSIKRSNARNLKIQENSNEQKVFYEFNVKVKVIRNNFNSEDTVIQAKIKSKLILIIGLAKSIQENAN